VKQNVVVSIAAIGGLVVCGICWLLVVSFVGGYLQEGVRLRRLWRRVMWLILFIGAIYGVSYGLLGLLR